MREALVQQGVTITGALSPAFEEILTADALTFVATLERRFRDRRSELLDARQARQAAFDAGEKPDFFDSTGGVRSRNWTVAPAPADLRDRRVEITGPVDRKMIINALNSGARVFMADFEDSTSPTWQNLLNGQVNLRDAVNESIEFTNEVGKVYRLQEETATLMVRPRGWHLDEKNVRVDGRPVSASIFDFGLFFFHNARALLGKGTGPYFYLPKLESHLEARLWNEIFVAAQEALDIPVGTIKATVLIETITAAFEMDEILYELRDHSAGLNCGRWDYIFSFIKKFRNDPGFVLPDRARVTMTRRFLRSYSLLLIQTCHRRQAHAMGGMAAQIPIRDDATANEEALNKVAEDKEREVWNGHDGTWVAHPALIPVAMKAFDDFMTGPNQLHRLREDMIIRAEDLLAVPTGRITEGGLRTNLRVGVEYLAAWLNGNGCVPLNNLMEDAATAEISRAQVWQWIHHSRGVLEDGRKVTAELACDMIEQELHDLNVTLGEQRFQDGKYELAAELFEELITADDFEEFLTLPAYRLI